MTSPPVDVAQRAVLVRRGYLLEGGTLAWNVVGVIVLAYLAVATASVAILGFGLNSLIEIGASTVVIWELSGTGEARQRRALRLIGIAFIALAGYLLVQSTVALISQHHPADGIGGIVWTGITAVDGLLAVAVLIGLTLDALFGRWWADPVAGLVIVYYAIREAIHIFHR